MAGLALVRDLPERLSCLGRLGSDRPSSNRWVRPRIGIGARLAALVLAGMGGMALVLLVGISGLRSAMDAERQSAVRSVLEAVVSQIEADGARTLSGTLDRAVFLARAKAVVASTRFGGGDYVFMYGWDGTDLSDGGWPGNVGENLLDTPDAQGFLFRRAIVDVAHERGTGMVSYVFPRAGGTEPLRKHAYVHALPALGLIVASGFYLDDLDDDFDRAASVVILVAAMVVAVCAGAAAVIARDIRRPLRALTARLNGMTEGRLDGFVPGAQRQDEIGDMARAVQQMRDHALERRTLRAARDVLAAEVAELGKAAAAAERLARTDVLTGLTNRSGFVEAMAACAGSGVGFALLCLDLDRFKAVNDTLGHPVGDLLLRQVSARLLACVREDDTVARLGGDEFMVIQVAGAGSDAAMALAGRIVEELARPYRLGAHDMVEIGVSIGLAVSPADGTEIGTLVERADQALYWAKQDGRSCWRAWSRLPSRLGPLVETCPVVP